MNGGPPGFHNAPVTRAIVICSALFTFIFGLQGRSNKLPLSFKDVSQELQPWRVIVSMNAFTSTTELMVGLYLLYYFRVFERQKGSNKYSVFILFSASVSFLLENVVLALLKDPNSSISSGPYGLIFASFVPFFFDIPVTTRFKVLGFNFSDKFFIYLAGLQLLLSSWKRSVIPGICGIIAGALYHMNVFNIRKAKLPNFITSLFSWISWPSSSERGPSSSSSGTRTVLNAPSYGRRQLETNYPAPPMVSPVEPSEESVAMLVSMGFDQDSARQALVQARNDITVATNILLEAQSH